jgi:integrase
MTTGRLFSTSCSNPARPPEITFDELADQFLRHTEEEAAANRMSQKWVDKQRANVALIGEIVGPSTPVHRIDYDACLRVRSMLARIPANRSKIYGTRPLEQAIERAAAEKRDLLSPITQGQYLAALRDVLDLAAKKRLIAVNPAEGLRPLRRDTVPDAEKRLPFTLEQIRAFFTSDFYTQCAKEPVPYAHDKPGWRFWMPPISLFMGMRPNEVAQLLTSDLKRTNQSTWYLDIATIGDEDDGDSMTVPKTLKTLKTATSRRKIPLHPELIAIGFLPFVEDRKKSGSARLFSDLKPDKYGNHAWYPLKRFNESYLPQAIKPQPRQSFYSFRHSWRDALRRIDAPPDALQALGGWKQGKLTSDNYGDASNPDYQAQFLKRVDFPGLDLSGLYPKTKSIVS